MGNAIEVKTMKNKEVIALKVLSITAIPHISILKSSNESLQEIISKNDNNLKKLISEIYQIYKDGLWNARSNDICLELLWKTEEIDNQTYRANIKLFFIIRAVANNEIEAKSIVEKISALCCSALSYQKYDFFEMTFSEFQKGLVSIDNSSVYAITKDDGFASLQNQILPFTYSFGKYDGLNISLEKIINSLIDYPGVAISFQIMPSAFNNAEISIIDTTAQNLQSLSTGVYEQGIGNIRVSLAEKDAAVYRYYSEHKKSPTFLYNIIIIGSKTAASHIVDIISGQLSAENEVSIKKTTLSDINLNNNFFPLPWAINHRLIQNSNCYHQAQANQSLQAYTRLSSIITNEEVISFFKLPIGSDNLSAGINIRESQRSNKLFAKDIINSADISIGTLKSSSNGDTIGFSLKDLAKHMLVVGTPGSGKTTFSVSLLDRLWKDHHIPFLVIEPAKNEYRALVQSIPDLQVFTPGKNFISPFVFNPFVPPKNVKLETYKSTLKTAFAAAVSMSTPLDKIFEESINNCYSDFRWLDTYTIDDKGKIFNIADFIKCFQQTFDDIGYTGDAKNIGRAGVVRLNSLVNLFDNYYSIPIEDLLQKPTIIELAAIENADQKALIISLLLLSILAYVNANYVGEGGLKNVILLEEAHVLLDSGSNKGEGEANPSAIAQGLVKRMLAEIRSYGVGLIIADQSPRKVTSDVVALTDMKMVFRLVESEDKQIISDSTNMSEAQSQRMSKLKPGEAFLFFNKLDEPEEVITPDYRLDNNISISLSDASIKELTTYWNDKSEKLKPYPQCAYCRGCLDGCDYYRRVLAREIARRIFVRNFKANDDKFDTVIKVFRQISKLVRDELNDEPFTQELLSCVKLHLWRKIKYGTNIPITNIQIENSLKK